MKSTGKNEITSGVIWKQILIFFFPILIGAIFQTLYNTVDAVVVGRFSGKIALASVGGSSGLIIELVITFFMGLASGATVIISQAYGSDDRRRIDEALHTAYTFALVQEFFWLRPFFICWVLRMIFSRAPLPTCGY